MIVTIDYKWGMDMSNMKILKNCYKKDTTWKDIEDFAMADGEAKRKIAERICCFEVEVPEETVKL